MTTEEELENEICLTSPEDGPVASPEDPVPFMTFDYELKKARYYVLIRHTKDASGNPTEIELTAEAYRDVVSTLGVRLQNQLLDVINDVGRGDIVQAIRQIAYWDEK